MLQSFATRSLLSPPQLHTETLELALDVEISQSLVCYRMCVRVEVEHQLASQLTRKTPLALFSLH